MNQQSSNIAKATEALIKKDHHSSSNNPRVPASAAPAVALQLADIPQLNESRSSVYLVDMVLVLHPLMTGQSYILGCQRAIRCRTPLHGPDGATCKQQHVPAIWVRRQCLEPGSVIHKERISLKETQSFRKTNQ